MPSIDERLRLVLDTSGSMLHMSQAAYDGAVEVIENLPDGATVCFDTFADEYVAGESVSKEVAVAQVRAGPTPRGRTCLYDAIGAALTRELDESSGTASVRTSVVLLTDGFDTASREYTPATTRILIGRAAEAGVHVLFLGTNQDAVTQADAIGIPVARALTFGASEDGVIQAMRSVSQSMSRRRADEADGGFTHLERQASMVSR